MINASYKISIGSLMLYFFASLVSATEINKGYFGTVAIRGYDPVAYFTEQQPVKGREDISYRWLGADWQFSSAKHKQLFTENPIKYAPQYGGHCSDGIAYGSMTTNIDPTAWRIINGKLYLNYDEGAAIELEEVEGQLEKAEENWPRIRSRLLADSD